MEIKTTYTCPLGSTCEKLVNDTIERCAWFVKVEGEHPQTGEFMSESKCTMYWQTILMLDTNGKMNQNTASIDSLRNETIKRQDAALALGAIDAKKIIASS